MITSAVFLETIRDKASILTLPSLCAGIVFISAPHLIAAALSGRITALCSSGVTSTSALLILPASSIPFTTKFIADVGVITEHKILRVRDAGKVRKPPLEPPRPLQKTVTDRS